MIPKNIGRYEIVSEIGHGGMATVYQAYDPSFERDVAIKVLPHTLLHNPQFRVRFEREAKTIAALEHPAIVPVYDFGEEIGQPYIVMRLMTGGSLSDRLLQGALPVITATTIISRLAPALDAAHQRGIIHRDLKPDNILFDQYDNAYISDFGIARLIQATETLTGSAVIGTPAYMSPEQVQAQKALDGRSDIYSLGVILYQMLTGETPYQASTPAKLMMMHVLEPVPKLKTAKPEIQADYESIIIKSLAKEPNDRYPTVKEMADALHAAATAERPPPLIKKSEEPETYIAATRVMAEHFGESVSNAEQEMVGHRAQQQQFVGGVPPTERIYTPRPYAPSPTPEPSPVPIAKPSKKTPSLTKIILISIGVIACSSIILITFLGMGGLFNNPAKSSTSDATAIALNVKATRDAKSLATEQALLDEAEAVLIRGKEIASLQGCIACHTNDGSTSIGPSWKGFYNSTVTLDSGEVKEVDYDFIRLGILNPKAQVLSGYSADLMPTDYAQKLTSQQIDELVAYIISLEK
jgi:serine/threonine protein kinase